MRTGPGDEHDEEAGQQHLRRVERRLRPRHPHAGETHLLRAGAVAVEERLLSAHAAQDTEPGCGVGSQRGQLADLLPLPALTLLQRLDHDAERERQDRHPDEDEQPELRRGREQDHRHDDVGDDPAAEARHDVECAARPERVVRDGGDDLSRRDLAAERVAGARRVVADDLDQPVRRLQPVLHRVAVPHDPRQRLDHPEDGEEGAEPYELVVLSLHDPLLDRLADRVRHQRLRDHPDDPEEDRDREGGELVARDPEEEAHGRPGVRPPRIGDRKVDHGRTSGLYAIR